MAGVAAHIRKKNTSCDSFKRIKYLGVNFLSTICPTEEAIPLYLQVLERNKVTTLVRINCDIYDATPLTEEGIKVIDLYFAYTCPEVEVIQVWAEIVRNHINDCISNKHATLAVHCTPQRYRAPLMIALALMDLGMRPRKVMKMLKMRKMGNYLNEQIEWLKSYREAIKENEAL